MADMTLHLEQTGRLTTSTHSPPPPPVIKRSLYLQCSSDSGSVSAASLTIPSLGSRQAKAMAAILREVADKLESPAVIKRAGSPRESGVKIDLMAVLGK
jgi:hypothetical protein